ncbi:Peptide synthase [Durusdinium trenchii]|uniref:Peptide synthase n=1 Tax=Durusdinium trenchii TaxID=1381693 RepID=A0ABP0R579_9DINO
MTTETLPADLVDFHQVLQLNINQQEMHLVVSFDGRLDGDRLKRAVRLIWDREPILGCRLVEGWYRPSWRRRDDLDSLDPCPVVEETASGERRTEFMVTQRDPRRDPLLSVQLFRGETDTLCVKMSHLVGDASALIKVTRLIGDYYTRLATEPDFRPDVNQAPRAYRAVTREFSWKECFRVIGKIRENRSIMKSLWQVNTEDYDPSVENTQPYYVVRKIPAEVVSRATLYGRRKARATWTTVILAAYYTAMRSMFSFRFPEEPGLVVTTVDVRQKLPAEKRTDHAVSNMSGPVRLRVSPDPSSDFQEVLEELTGQFKSSLRDGTLGFDNPMFVLSMPPLRWLLALVPFSLLRRRSRRFVADNVGTPFRMGGVANLGSLSEENFPFDGVKVEDTWFAGALFRHFGIGIIATGFEGAVTMCVGFHSSVLHREKGEELLDRMVRELEALEV